MVNTRRANYESETSQGDLEQIQASNTLLTILQSMVERNGILIQEINGTLKNKYDELQEEYDILNKKYDVALRRYKEKVDVIEEYKDRVFGYERAVQEKQKLQTDLECNSLIVVLLFFVFIVFAFSYAYYMNTYCKRV